MVRFMLGRLGGRELSLVTFIYFLCWVVFPVWAGPKTLSLIDAQHMAFERNWDLLAARAGIDVASAQRIVAHEFPNPTLSASTAKVSIGQHPSSNLTGNGLWERSYDTIFAVNQLFEIGGKRRNRQASALAGYEGARAQFFDAKRALDLGVTKAYVAAAAAAESVRVLTQSAATLRQEAQLAEVRLKAGEISSSDKNQIDITADRFELDARSAESAAAQARVALQVLLGVTQPKGDIVLSDGIEALSASSPPPGMTDSTASRPDVVAAEAALRKAEADLRLQKANRIPDPTFLVQYEHEPPDLPNTLGFGVSLPLPLWNRNKGNILGAQAVREQTRLAVEKTRAQASAEIATARLAFESALQRWQSYRDAIRPKSDQIRQALAYAYQRGGASLLDMLLAERNDNDIRLAAAQAAADTAVAGATLKAATTGMPPGK